MSEFLCFYVVSYLFFRVNNVSARISKLRVVLLNVKCGKKEFIEVKQYNLWGLWFIF